jgi:galactokinase
MRQNIEQALQLHLQRFGTAGIAFSAPARVNLIGEHTDYTGGLVLPMAIGFWTNAVVSPRTDTTVSFYSENFGEEAHIELKSFSRLPTRNWSDYPAGVLWSLREEGLDFGGFDMTLEGNVPLGAGLSSSASVEVAAAMALLEQAGTRLPVEKLARICRRAENEYVGAKSGIMDQFVVSGAVADQAMLLDCRSLKFELLPLPSHIRIVICNSMVKHSVSTGEYGNRRDEVESGQAVLRERLGIGLLRDATLRNLEAVKDDMLSASYARCRHIISENLRVLAARDTLLQDDMNILGRLMYEAHISMRDDFAASCAEVDLLVEIAMRQKECFGARITGGGFGGCTVNVVSAESAENFVRSLSNSYATETGINAECFICAPVDGALALAAKNKMR